VIVDVGTAITVDLISADGAFLGGAILPGIQMAARALHHFTDLLPLVDVSELAVPPPALGDATESAMKSGLFWGAVGAIRQLIEQLCETASSDGWGGSSTASPTTRSLVAAPTQVFLTGGAGAAVAELLGRETRHVPNLTLSGIAQIGLEHETCGTGERRRTT
jgi:type III pantothenate kinase